eukprot:scaffold99211_cov16-Prasinocladus_malaysianus.AAC.1
MNVTSTEIKVVPNPVNPTGYVGNASQYLSGDVLDKEEMKWFHWLLGLTWDALVGPEFPPVRRSITAGQTKRKD